MALGLIATALAGGANAVGDAAMKTHEQQIQLQREQALLELKQQGDAALEATRQEGETGRTVMQQEGATQRTGMDIGSREKVAGQEITSREGIVGKEIASREKISGASNALTRISLGIQQGQLTLAQQRDAIDNSLKTIQVANAQTLQNLQEQYKNEVDTTKKAAIRDDIQMLTGKDNDNFTPVPTGFDEVTGKPTGYKIFDRKNGNWVEPPAGAGAAPPQAAIDMLKKNPAMAPQFKAKYNVDPAQYLTDKGAAAPPVAGRPLYSAKQPELTRLAGRPKGVSVAQAQEAQAELDARKGEARMSEG